MGNILLTKSDSDTLIFHFWKSLKYNHRLALSFLLILAGIAVQIIYLDLLPGIIIIFVGVWVYFINQDIIKQENEYRKNLDKFNQERAQYASMSDDEIKNMAKAQIHLMSDYTLRQKVIDEELNKKFDEFD